jgi:hypothetical protein
MRFSFSASSVWGVSTRFCVQIGMIPRCEQSFGTPQGGQRRVRRRRRLGSVARANIQAEPLPDAASERVEAAIGVDAAGT